MSSRIIISPAIFLIAACGSPSKPAEPPKALVWKDMNADQRQAYMKDVVLPKAKVVFAAFDPKFQTMDCKTCHGDGVDDGSYEMPNPKIKPLPNTEAAFMAWLGKDAEAARYTPFMADKVEPLMGDLLHMTVFDPKTMSGEFGCSSCHTLVDADGKIVAPPKPAHGHDHAH
ncbi:MAG: hypothetical protein IPQ07_03660 [Myxococcales bacterium]|nr:hypothetical protein [Myxococcales bacterium]